MSEERSAFCRQTFSILYLKFYSVASICIRLSLRLRFCKKKNLGKRPKVSASLNLSHVKNTCSHPLRCVLQELYTMRYDTNYTRKQGTAQCILFLRDC
jgi:hypothetical protein